MSSSVSTPGSVESGDVERDGADAADRVDAVPGRRRPLRRPHGRIAKALVWLHRWTSLVIGILLMAELVSGTILLQNAVRAIKAEVSPRCDTSRTCRKR